MALLQHIYCYCIRYIRHQMYTQAAKMYTYSMIFSHIIYCLPIWSLASVTSLKPLQSLYKRTVKILDKKVFFIIVQYYKNTDYSALKTW